MNYITTDQIQVAPINLVDIEQYLHDTGAVWDTIGNQSQEHFKLLWLA
jgi:hypothetical protein